jgi:hypothetical protein
MGKQSTVQSVRRNETERKADAVQGIGRVNQTQSKNPHDPRESISQPESNQNQLSSFVQPSWPVVPYDHGCASGHGRERVHAHVEKLQRSLPWLG